MLNGLPPSAKHFLFDVERLTKRVEKAQRQLTSGLKVSRVSDDPDSVSRMLSIRASLQTAAQTQLNLGRVKTEVDTAEKTLGQGVQLMERARQLGAQGASGHQSKETRQRVADELQGILDRLVTISAVAVEGRYLFSGDNDQVAPYQLDPLTPSGVGAYQGTASTRQVADASGLAFPVALTADILFDSANADEKVFEAVNGMRRALLAVDNPPLVPDPTIPTLEQAQHNLGTATQYLNQKLASYGLYQNRVNESLEASKKLELSLKQQLAGIEEADLTEAATELNQAKLSLDAAFEARAKTPRRSLFDYLG